MRHDKGRTTFADRDIRVCLQGCSRLPTVRIAWDEWYCKTHARETADRLARISVMERDRYTCQRSGLEAHDVHHIFTKAAWPSLRWEPDNLIALTRDAHVWWHANPAEAGSWFAEKFADRWARLHAVRSITRRFDLADVISGFRELTPTEAAAYRDGDW